MKDCKGNELNIGDCVVIANVNWEYEDVDGILRFGTIVEDTRVNKSQTNDIIIEFDNGIEEFSSLLCNAILKLGEI